MYTLGAIAFVVIFAAVAYGLAHKRKRRPTHSSGGGRNTYRNEETQ